ncbi:MAG: hypothetical protein ABH821_00380 [archaeon]
MDSNVFISFVREEIDSSFNLRGVDSESFFTFCSKNKVKLILSGLFFEEVERVVFLTVKDVLEAFERHDIVVEVFSDKPSKELVSRIVRENKIHFEDAVHTAVSIESKSEAVITWNKKDFLKVSKLINIYSPSEILANL